MKTLCLSAIVICFSIFQTVWTEPITSVFFNPTTLDWDPNNNQVSVVVTTNSAEITGTITSVSVSFTPPNPLRTIISRSVLMCSDNEFNATIP